MWDVKATYLAGTSLRDQNWHACRFSFWTISLSRTVPDKIFIRNRIASETKRGPGSVPGFWVPSEFMFEPFKSWPKLSLFYRLDLGLDYESHDSNLKNPTNNFFQNVSAVTVPELGTLSWSKSGPQPDRFGDVYIYYIYTKPRFRAQIRHRFEALFGFISDPDFGMFFSKISVFLKKIAFFLKKRSSFLKKSCQFRNICGVMLFMSILWLYRRYFCRVRKRDNFRHVSRVKKPNQVSSRTVRDKKNAENEKQQACQF